MEWEAKQEYQRSMQRRSQSCYLFLAFWCSLSLWTNCVWIFNRLFSLYCIFIAMLLVSNSLIKLSFFLTYFVTESSEPPTPHYNSSVLGDLLPRAHLQFLSAVSSQCSAFTDGVALLKVWLRQRELDQVGSSHWFSNLLHRVQRSVLQSSA